MIKASRAAGVVAFLAIAACATGSEQAEPIDPKDDPRVGEKVERICFRSNINGFQDWDRGEGIILQRGVRDMFLVTFNGPCRIANRAQRVGFNSRFATAGCVEDIDSLYLAEGIGRSSDRFSSQQCLINEIYEYGVPDDDASEDDDT